jgi:hypothetical protein
MCARLSGFHFFLLSYYIPSLLWHHCGPTQERDEQLATVESTRSSIERQLEREKQARAAADEAVAAATSLADSSASAQAEKLVALQAEQARFLG